MIVKTTKEINGVLYDYTYSDIGMMIERNGAYYSEAIDPIDSDREYTETENLLTAEGEENEATAEDYESALSEFGVKV